MKLGDMKVVEHDGIECVAIITGKNEDGLTVGLILHHKIGITPHVFGESAKPDGSEKNPEKNPEKKSAGPKE